jgi:short-subunit dehydrogenase
VIRPAGLDGARRHIVHGATVSETSDEGLQGPHRGHHGCRRLVDTEALRMELELEGAPVGVTCVHPGGIATQIARSQRVDEAIPGIVGEDADHFRRRSERLIQTTTPEAAARSILAGVRRNARRVLVGPDARAVDIMVRVLGAGYQRLMIRRVQRMRRRT